MVEGFVSVRVGCGVDGSEGGGESVGVSIGVEAGVIIGLGFCCFKGWWLAIMADAEATNPHVRTAAITMNLFLFIAIVLLRV